MGLLGVLIGKGSGQSPGVSAIQALLAIDVRVDELRAQVVTAARLESEAAKRYSEKLGAGDVGADAAGEEFAALRSRADVLRKAVGILENQRDSKLALIATAKAEQLEAEGADLRRQGQKLRQRMEPHWKAIFDGEFDQKDYDPNLVRLATTDDLIEKFPLVAQSTHHVDTAAKLELEASQLRFNAVAVGRSILEGQYV